MANFTVAYLFQLRDDFSAKARKLARESQNARKSVHGLGSVFGGMEARANQAGAAIGRLAHRMRALRTAGRGLTLGGLGGSFGTMMLGKSLLGRYAEFEKAEIFSRALGSELKQTKADMDKLVLTARKLGATTIFEPQDVLQGGNTFLKAGRTAIEAMNSLPSVVNLAAVAELTVAKAADSTLNLMAQANIPAEKLKTTIDALTATFMSAKAEMGQLANAAGYLLPTLAPLGVSLQQQFAILGTLSEAGQTGTRGARGFSMALTQLKKGQFMKKQAGLMKQYGINMKEFLDADGKIKGGNIMPLLNKIRDVEKQSKGTFIDQFFPVNAGRMLKSFYSRFEVMDKILGNMEGFGGATGRLAKKRFEGLTGAVKQLSAAWSEFAIKVGEGGLGKAAEGWVRWATDSLNALGGRFAALSPQMRKFITNAALIAGAVSLAAVPLAIFAVATGALVPAVAALAGGLSVLARFAALPFFAGLGAAVGYMTRLTAAFLQFGPVATGVLAVTARVITGFTAIGAAIYYWKELSQVVMGFFSGLSSAYAGSELQTAVSWLTSAISGIATAVGQITGISFEGSGLQSFFNAGKAAAEALLSPITSIQKALGWIGGKLGIVGQAQAVAGKMNINPNTARRMLTPPASNPSALLGGLNAYEKRLGRSSVPLPIQRQSVDVKVTTPPAIEIRYNGPITGPGQINVGTRNRGDTSTSSAETETP